MAIGFAKELTVIGEETSEGVAKGIVSVAEGTRNSEAELPVETRVVAWRRYWEPPVATELVDAGEFWEALSVPLIDGGAV
jgi:hypothetical protein